jgi:di/tricarboxylate transporter
MFDFAPVGLTVAIFGILYLITIGWRLLPRRITEAEQDQSDQFQIARYSTEVRIPAESPLIGTTVGSLEKTCDNEVSVLVILRNDRRRVAPLSIELLQAGDVLILEGHSETLQPLFENPGVLEAGAEEVDTDWLKSPDVRVIEAVVMPNSAIEGLSMRGIGMHQRYGVNLLAVAREGRAARTRLKHIKYKTGDVLLLQGETQALEELCLRLGCLAIKNRGLEITPRRGVFLIPATFALGIFVAAMGWLPVQIAFTTVVGALVLFKMVSLRTAYRSIEWPIIVLLGFLIPIGESLQSTGTTELIAQGILSVAADLPVWSLLALVMAVSMLLSDLVHNTPTAVLMAPIALSLANGLGLSADPFLMAVAIGAASPYLTPIGHQSNTLVMGPGGYKFGDYWRLGLPLDAVILCVGVPMILWMWM